MIAQRVRKYGAKVRYQGEEAGKGQADPSNEVSAAKIVWGSFLEAARWRSTRGPAAPPASQAQVARDYQPEIGLSSFISSDFSPRRTPQLNPLLCSTCSCSLFPKEHSQADTAPLRTTLELP